MADLRLITVPPPYNGMNTIKPPGSKPVGTGPLVRNFLPHYQSKMVVRGPIFTYLGTDASFLPPAIMSSAWTFDDRLLFGFMSKSEEKTVPPWPYKFAGAFVENWLAEGNKSLGFIEDVDFPFMESESCTSEQVPVGPGARIEKYVYGYGMGGTPIRTSNFRWIRAGRLLRWDGTNKPPTVYETAPHGGAFVKAHLNRLFVLGGGIPDEREFTGIDTELPKWLKVSKSAFDVAQNGNLVTGPPIAGSTTIEGKSSRTWDGSTYEYFLYLSKNLTKAEKGFTIKMFNEVTSLEPNTLFYSDEYGPTVDNIDMWKDDISGLINRIVIGNEDQNDLGVALATVGQTLIIFKRHSIWALYGYSKSTYQVRQLTSERGCLDPHSICEANGGVFFFSQKGLEFFDGSEFKTVDDDISSITRPYAESHAGEHPFHDLEQSLAEIGRVQIEYLGSDYIMLLLTGQNPNTGALKGKRFTGLMHIPTHNWSEFTTNALTSTGEIVYVGATTAGPFIFDGQKLIPMRYLVNPNSVEVSGVGRRIDKDINEVTKTIPAKFITDRISLSSPGYMSQLHRYNIDYSFPFASSTDSQGEADGWWHVRIRNADGSDLVSRVRVPGQGSVSTTKYLNGRRYVEDKFTEAHDAVIEVDMENDIGSVRNPENPEVYETTLELQLTRQRRSA